ncbi:flavodoxin family protein [Desulforhopalus sp. IMCC35007]|uniref:flavodoxin family protein n=1 Tax=Desulforhopalus sp. IMCC35007 TaxID=2569543 RepID=UPI0010AEB669|nr:flavodoxin family protein [Desulforhopalus sp. IMCC35007]TKB10741.1 flavodoxin family protein [Desulforhopalus sp. IMCC35007]
MYAIAINGSPRKGGNTEMLLQEVLSELDAGGWETELVKVGGTAIRGCIACQKCFENKDNECSVKTDNFNEIFAKLLRADAIIMGSPTYFAAVSADLKALIERAGYVAYANDHAFTGKIGAAVVAVRRGGATHAYDTINHMFQMSRMVLPGSTYWNIGIGLQKGDVAEDAEGLANMRHLGKSIDWLGKVMKPAIESYPRG